VIVVEWPNLVAQISTGGHVEELGQLTCGLAIEYLLQLAYRPVLNGRRRSSDGEWSARNIESSRSRGAVASSQITALFHLVRAQWDTLATARRDESGAAVYSDAGRTIFPVQNLHAALMSPVKERD
jgi:hypothetical protein